MPAKPDPLDAIRRAVIARAAELGLTAYAIARDSGGTISEDQVARYIYHATATTNRLTDRKLLSLLRILGLQIEIKPAE
jgi:hypothetical protein